MNIKRSTFSIFLLAVFLKTAFVGYAQESDTVKIEIVKTIYDTISINETSYLYDTVYINRFIDGFDISPSFSSFFVKWRDYSNYDKQILKQKNFSAGFEFAAVKNNFSLSSGLFFTKYSSQSELNNNYTFTDSMMVTTIVANSYFDIDTIGTEWQQHTYDSIIDDSITIVITDSIQLFVTDSTEVFYNDTILELIEETENVDTTYLLDEKITYFEIPVIFRYRLYASKRIDIQAGTGILIGILRQTNMYYIAGSDRYTSLVLNKEYIKILPSFWLSGKIAFYPLPNFAVFAEPYYCPGLKSIFNKDFDLITIPDRYGVRFGVSWLL